MKYNRFLILLTIVALILIITIPTIIKVKNNQIRRYELVNESAIKDAANKCWNDNFCKNNTIYLKDLYDLKYLDKLIDYKTKEYLNDDSYVTRKGELITVTIVN